MFNAAILKLTSICNLNCTYCYMFNQEDRTYTRIPKTMDIDTALKSLDRMEEHLRLSGRKEFHVALHGGEPTLWPLSQFERFFKYLKILNSGERKLVTTIQTNGLAFDLKLAQLCLDYGIKIGISLDGPQHLNDTRRVNHAGQGSYNKIMATVNNLIENGYGSLLSGFLCVAPVDIPVDEFIKWADSLPIRDLDVLWPMEFNYKNTPWKQMGIENYMAHPRIGDWFAELFKEWVRKDDPSLKIRLFEHSISHFLGSNRHLDSIVNDKLTSIVINTDGVYEYHDYFRSHRDGACRTSYDVNRHAINDLANDEVYSFCLNLGDHLPAECEGCEFVKVCGGGFLPGRFDAFSPLPLRRSVLCFDEFVFFSAVKDFLSHSVVREIQLG